MKVVVLSDTHMPRSAKKLPDVLLAELTDADAIVHAGDWTQMNVYEMLAAFAPTYGVAGNNDGPDIQKRFGLKKVLKLGGYEIGLIHGHGPSRSIATETRAWNAFKDKTVDAIIYGHSHAPVLKHIGRTLILNPGSPTDKRRQPRYSYAVMVLSSSGIDARLILYDDKS